MSEKPPVTNQPMQGYGGQYGGQYNQGYGQGYGQQPIAMVPQHQAQVAGQYAPGETVMVQPVGYGPGPQLNPAIAAQCPPGMEYLASLDRVSIFQVLHLSEGKFSVVLKNVLTVVELTETRG